MPGDTHHVVPNSYRGGWDVKRGGADRAGAHAGTKSRSRENRAEDQPKLGNRVNHPWPS